MIAKKSTTDQLIITRKDYEILYSYVKGFKPVSAFDKENVTLLEQELRKAKVVKSDQLPEDIVRLNSRVVIKEGSKGKLFELVLVVPEKADIKEGRISVFAPIGTALIGFKQGAKIRWEVPSGNKTFTIIKVYNQQE